MSLPTVPLSHFLQPVGLPLLPSVTLTSCLSASLAHCHTISLPTVSLSDWPTVYLFTLRLPYSSHCLTAPLYNGLIVSLSHNPLVSLPLSYNQLSDLPVYLLYLLPISRNDTEFLWNETKFLRHKKSSFFSIRETSKNFTNPFEIVFFV
jgi:hypothetical protein